MLALHTFLREEHDAILYEWGRRGRVNLNSAKDLSPTDLLNNMPDILTDIADESELAVNRGRRLKFPKEGPLEHANQRWSLGFSLEEVSEEYSFLRTVIMDRLSMKEVQLPDDRLLFLHEALDSAIVESVNAYVAKSNDELRSEQELLRVTLESIWDGVISTDIDGRIAFLNSAAERISGWSQSDAVGRHVDDVLIMTNESTGKPSEGVALRAVATEEISRYPDNKVLRRYDGELLPVEEHSTPLKDGEGHSLGAVTTIRDISSIRSLTSELSYLASHDSLTGLPNRTLLFDRLDQSIAHADRHAEMVAVLYIDLDLFKGVNDAYGHAAGDELLKQVGERLSACVRQTDTVSRLGGDEFAILLTDFSKPTLPEHVSEKILKRLKPHFVLDQGTASVSASIGISLYPGDGNDAATLIKYADTAMYQAKSSGRGHTQFFTPEMNERLILRRKLENDLHSAITKNQLSLNFQPQFELSSGELIGAEALLRWQHPQDGFISPDRFIPVAEESPDLITRVGHWVIEHACMQARSWLDAGYQALRISVNISIAQLRNDRFLPYLKNQLCHYRIPPDMLQIELTESIFVSEIEGAMDRVKGLKDLGVHLAIDDFGTGYSSLSYLKILPVNELKIDQSFVRNNLKTDTDNATIIQAVIRMSQSMNLRVVAEGVETKETVDFLTAQNCDIAQGYFYSEALPPPDFERQFLGKTGTLP